MGLFDFFKGIFSKPIVEETPVTVTKDVPLEKVEEKVVSEPKVVETPVTVKEIAKEEPKIETVVKETPKVETVTVKEEPKPVVKEEPKKVEEPVKEPVKVDDSVLKLSKEDYIKAAKVLNVEYAAVRAVAEVESSGKAFLEPGKPQILFEGHIFWKQLKNAGKDPQAILNKNLQLKTVLYPKWTKEFYKSGLKEYDRLKLAMTVDELAAIASASWGMFQIMGFNYASCGYSDVKTFVIAMRNSAYNQLEAFCKFIKSNSLDKYLRSHDWAGFAKRYNGAGYAQNQYDVKLMRAYKKYA